MHDRSNSSSIFSRTGQPAERLVPRKEPSVPAAHADPTPLTVGVAQTGHIGKATSVRSRSSGWSRYFANSDELAQNLASTLNLASAPPSSSSTYAAPAARAAPKQNQNHDSLDSRSEYGSLHPSIATSTAQVRPLELNLGSKFAGDIRGNRVSEVGRGSPTFGHSREHLPESVAAEIDRMNSRSTTADRSTVSDSTQMDNYTFNSSNFGGSGSRGGGSGNNGYNGTLSWTPVSEEPFDRNDMATRGSSVYTDSQRGSQYPASSYYSADRQFSTDYFHKGNAPLRHGGQQMGANAPLFSGGTPAGGKFENVFAGGYQHDGLGGLGQGQGHGRSESEVTVFPRGVRESGVSGAATTVESARGKGGEGGGREDLSWLNLGTGRL
ncbi:hypothetical protein LTS18_011528 [Coniosporium uncinatum]|uniref:Uncharacterized protein n=1 Tax=Coniosporium uncinatum TaxID=93489 RepID=A0ACC3CYH6_9PEZI|nr:hypothetical protein LTS18_011528 [Coniosporium uncinatum]